MAQLAHELVDDAAARTPATLALRHDGDGISYAALAAAGATLAGALRACGTEKDDRVAVRLPAGAAFVSVLLGASSAGCAVVPIDPALDDERCAALLRDCGAVVLVTGAAGLAGLHALLPACPLLRTVVLHGAASSTDLACAATPQRVLAWDDFMALPACAGAVPEAAGLAALLYRVDSGGVARGMALSHRNLVAGAQSTARCAGIGSGDRVLVALPAHGDHGLNALLATFAAGATAVLDNACSASLLARSEPRGLFVSPAALGGLAAGGLASAAACLRYLVCAGGAPDWAALERVRSALPRTRIHLLYEIGDCRSTSLMAAMPAMPAMPGLAPRETGSYPGIAARKDADGFLYLVDTGGDTIVTRGYRVSPRDVEKILTRAVSP